MGGGGRSRTLEHPGRILVVAISTGLASWLAARHRPVPTVELRLVTWFNAAPDVAAAALWPIMQVGTLGAPIVLAVVVLALRRDRVLAGAVLIGGLLAWYGAKVIKDLVQRGRPLVYLPDIEVRDGVGDGFGYLSGHSAVSMFTVVMAMAVIPRRWRPVAVLVAGVVGIARMVDGMHLPADVVGGWAFGAIIAVGALEVVDRVRRAPVAESASTP